MSEYPLSNQTAIGNTSQPCSSKSISSYLKIETRNVEIDKNLTFQNAGEKGYQWVKDTIFSPSAPALAQEITNLVNQGYRLGQPSANSASKVFVGLYKKV